MVRDIAGLYLDPSDLALAVLADEKSQVQALDHTGSAVVHATRTGGTAHP